MTTTVIWTSPLQWGVSAAGVWADLAPDDVTGDLTLQTGASEGGAIFDATSFQTLRFASGRILDGPILVSATLSFSVTRIGVSTGPWTLEVGIVPEAAPALYSTSALPWARGETSLGDFDLGTVPQIPATLAVTHAFTGDAALSLRALATSKAAWSGRMALSFRTSGTVVRLKNGPSFAFSLTTEQAPSWNGLVDSSQGGRRRYVRDHRFGMPALNTELVRDGDQPGLWVRPSDADPLDEPNTYRPRPGEGTVDDEIGDL